MSDTLQKINVGRRDLLRTAGLIGVAGTAASAMAQGQSQAGGATGATPPLCTAGSIPADLVQPPEPEGLSRNAPGTLVDNRYPITFERSVPATVAVLTQHFKALLERNLEGIADTMHYPFASHEQYANHWPMVVHTREEFFKSPPPSVNTTMKPVRGSDQDGWLRPGLYDVLVGLEVLQFNPVMCNAAMTFDRYDENGKLVHRCQGVYLVSNNDGRWAIQLCSTIFTPASVLGGEWEDSIANAFRPRLNHVQSIWDGAAGPARHNTYPRVGVMGGGVSTLTNRAAEGPMAAFDPRGVTTRLSIQERPTDPAATPPAPQGPGQQTRPPGWQPGDSGTGGGETGGYDELAKGQRGGSTVKMRDGRVLHHNNTKVHLVSGVERWNTSGEELNTTQQVQVVTYKGGVWARDLDFGYFDTHSRLNDIPVGRGY